MNPQEEAKDLKENDVPVVIINPLARVVDLDWTIQHLQEQITDLMRQREEALQYAVENKIESDDRFRLDKSVRRTRHLNIAKFKEVFPSAYEMACAIEKKKIEDELVHVGEKLNITLVDKLVPKENLLAAPGVVNIDEKVSYRVVLK